VRADSHVTGKACAVDGEGPEQPAGGTRMGEFRNLLRRRGCSSAKGAAVPHAVWQRLVAAFLRVMMLAFVAMPGIANASALCTAVNSGRLNFQTTYTNAAVSSTTARYTSSGQVTVNTLQADAGSVSTGEAASLDGAGPYGRLASGEILSLQYQVTGFSGSISVSAALGRGTTTTASTSSGTAANGLQSNTSGTITYTATGSETFLRLFVSRAGASVNATVAVSMTCALPASPPTIDRVQPVSGSTAGGNSVVITGSSFTGATAVSFGGTAATSFTVNSDTQITAVAPAHAAGAVNVLVTTDGGTATATNAYTYIAAPTVTALAPTSGPAGGGNSVVITGTNFGGGDMGATTTVAFGATPATSATVNSNTQITAVAPPGTGAVNVRVTTGGGTSAAAPANQYTYVPPPPAVSSITPTGGSSGGGTPVTITGTGFVSGNTYTATFGATAVAATYTSATTLTATAPAGTGTVQVTVANTTTAQAGTGSAAYTYAAPTVTGLSVTAGPAGVARSVTITGTNFTPTATVSVGATAATGVTYVSATQLTATLPAKAAGTYDVLVTTGAVTSSANPPADQYTYVVAPTVTSVTPNAGSTAGGTAVTIGGTGLSGATAVTFGGNAATNVVVAGDGNSLTATTPAGAAGATTIAVTTPGGTGQLAGGYTYVVLNPPAVTSQPANQTVAVGATATFTAGASGSPSPQVQWQVSSDSGASFSNVPANGNGTSYVTPATTAADNGNQYRAVFTNSQGSATTAPATLTVVQAPTANSQAVTAAYQTATAITLTATDPNNPARTLTYTVTAAPAHGTLSGTAPNLTYTPAAGYTGPDSFSFTANNGVVTSNTATVSITVQQPLPVVNAVSPGQGPTAGGTSITIVGSGFTGATAVTIGGNPATNVTVSSDTQITATTPAGTVGRTSVVVTNSTGSNAANTLFNYVGAPTATAQSVATGFNTARAITLTGSDPNTPARTLTYTVATQPQHGTLSGTAPNLTYTPAANYIGGDSFTFTVNNGTSTSAPATVSITVAAPPAPAAPVVTGPANGAIVATNTPTITGTTATGTTVAIYIDGALNGAATVTGTSFSYTPGTALGQGTHTVYAVAGNAGGPSPQSNTNTFTVDTVAPAAPVITSPANGSQVTSQQPPISGTAEAGSTVRVFVDGTPVGAVTASGGGTFTVTSSTLAPGQHTATASATDAAGNISPTSPGITFTVVIAPVISAITPTSGPTAGGTTVQANGSGLATVTSVRIGGIQATNLQHTGDTVLTFTTPASAAGTKAVVAANAAGDSNATVGFTYVAPTLAASPPAGALPQGTTGIAYSQTLTTTGGIAPYTYAIATGSLPAGLTLSSGGALSGTPTAAGTFTFTVTATDSSSGGSGGPYTLNTSYSLTVNGGSVVVSPATVPSPQVGVAYSQAFSAAGGTGPYTFSVSSGTLPTGLTFNAATATLSGTPTAGGPFSFTITATDSSTGTGAPFSGSRSYSSTVQAPALAISPAEPSNLPNAAGGVAYSQTITTSGGTAPYSYAVVAGTLPPGLTLSSGGVLAGTPSAAGTYSFRVRSTDSSTGLGPYATQGTGNYSLTVVAPSITLAPATLSDGTVGQAYSQTVTASGGSAPYTYTVTQGALPTGLTLSTGGTISGTPTAGGTFTFRITATDAGNFAGSRDYALGIGNPTIAIAPAVLPDVQRNVAYSQTLAASGGTAPYTYAVTAGALPAGLTLATNGTLSGRATAAGSFTFTVTATDASTGSGPYAGARSYTLTVAAVPITIAPTSLPAATTRITYSQALTATGGVAPYSYAVTAGGLPAGITLSAGGTLSGTANTAGTYNFTVTAADANGNAGSRGYTLTVNAPAITLAPATLPAATTRIAYSQTLAASGGTAPYSYAVTAGALPAGISLAASGTLSGTATTAGSFTFTVTATDANGNAGSRGYTLAVNAPAITVAPATLADGTVATSYAARFTATGGNGSYTFAVTAGALPAGLTVSSGGALAGTPTAGGSFTFTVTATDTDGNAGGSAYTLTIAAPTIALAPATLPEATSNVAYRQSLSASGGTAPYSYAVTAGTLPAGLTLAADGTLAGTARQTGSFSFTVAARDASTGSGPYQGSRPYTLVVAAPAITLAPATLPDAGVAVAYAATLSATGGTAPYGFAVTAGALPAGLSLAAEGTLSGTPTAGGSFTFTVTATDADRNTGTRSYTLAVAGATITLTPATLPDATTRIAYRQSLSASGGVTPYRYTVTAGALPQGLNLAADGTLSGTPTMGGTFRFSVTATDSATGTGPYSATQAYTLTVATPAIALSPANLPNGSHNAAYTADITATGGTAPYGYAVTAGALPGGVALSTAGRLAGTPTAAGSYGFTVTATDANGNAGSQAYTLVIAQASQTISFANPGAKSLSDSPVTVTATASSGLPVSFVSTTSGVCTVQGNAVTLSQTGTCTIEARQDGNADIAAAAPVAQSFAVTAARLVASASQASVSGEVGTALSPVVPVTVTGGTAPYAYRLSGGVLPAGLQFAEATGTLSGTPTGGQAATAYTVTARDGSGQTASAGFTLTVAAPTLAIAPTTLPDGAYQGAYSQQLTVSGGTQPYRFAVTGGALPAGITLSATGLVSGTPTAFGRFQVTVTATDSSTGTGPYSTTQGYTLVIAAPMVPTAGDAAATVAYGSVNNVITPTLGGEITALAIATAPAHGSARAEGRTLVYTPAAGYAGPDRFTYTASNAGGTSAPGTVSVTVSAPAVTITPASLPDARQGDAYGQQLTAAGGTAPYAFALASGTLPAGITLSPTGLVSGTPTASGSATFEVRATDGSTGTGPFAATQRYTLTVALPAAPTVRPVPTVNAAGSSTAASTPTQIVLSDYVSGNYTGIVVVAQPQNGTVTLATSGARTIATYTPRAGFAGTDGFSFAAVGPGGRSAVTSIALSVTGTAPVAKALTASATQGTPVTVDLTAAATGGPFTAAAVTGISPAGSVTAQVVEGGSATARTYGLTLTPALSFSGTATVTYTLSNQFGASAPATVTLSVAARPDPTTDPSVNAVSAAQADATRRFARSQTDNFFRRNEQLHHGGVGTGGRVQGVGVSVAEIGALTAGAAMAPDVNDMAMLKSEHAQGVLGAELASGAVTIARGGMAGLAGARGRQVLQQGTGAAPGLRGNLDQSTGYGAGGDVAVEGTGDRRIGSVGIWSGGAVTVGAWDKDADRAKLTLTTSGLSAGADIKLAGNLIVGAGGGYGGDLTRINGGTAQIRGRSWSVAGYGSWAPIDGLFVDGIVGGGSLSFDTRRQVAQTGGTATGNRDGSMLFGSLAAGLDRRGTLDLSAYGRVEYLSARLDRYSEAGGGIYGLTFARRDLESVASVLGLRVGYPLPGWTPRVRGEWRHEFADTDAQMLDYADVANLRYATRGDFWIRDAFTIDVGAEFGLGRGWGVTTEVGATGGSGATAGTVRIGVRKEF